MNGKLNKLNNCCKNGGDKSCPITCSKCPSPCPSTKSTKNSKSKDTKDSKSSGKGTKSSGKGSKSPGKGSISLSLSPTSLATCKDDPGNTCLRGSLQTTCASLKDEVLVILEKFCNHGCRSACPFTCGDDSKKSVTCSTCKNSGKYTYTCGKLQKWFRNGNLNKFNNCCKNGGDKSCPVTCSKYPSPCPSSKSSKQSKSSGKGSKSSGKGSKSPGKGSKSSGKGSKSSGKGSKSLVKGSKSPGKGSKSSGKISNPSGKEYLLKENKSTGSPNIQTNTIYSPTFVVNKELGLDSARASKPKSHATSKFICTKSMAIILVLSILHYI